MATIEKPISGRTGLIIFACGCEVKLNKGDAIPAGCPKHDKKRYRENLPWRLNLAVKLYIDTFGRIVLTDVNGDGNVVFDSEWGDTDYSRMFEIIEDGLAVELGKEDQDEDIAD